MKRTVPLLITAIGGFVMIMAFFVPIAEWLGEFAAICFDVLAAIAFILGGGNLLKIHLKKISDRSAGWAYSAITFVSFLVMLYVGLSKTGTHPAKQQEYYGEAFATLELEDLPDTLIFKVDGEIPKKSNGKKLPASARRQLTQEDEKLVFHGWMQPNQQKDLTAYKDQAKWKKEVALLFKAAQPNAPLEGKASFYVDHRTLAFKGYMSDDEKKVLLALAEDSNTAWKSAVDSLYEQCHKEYSIHLENIPAGVTVSTDSASSIYFDKSKKQLIVKGPMSTTQRDIITNQFLLAKPLRGDRRQQFLKNLESKGKELSESQLKAFDKKLDAAWNLPFLQKTLKDAGEDVSLNEKQKELLAKFTNDDELSVAEFIEELKLAGPFTKGQEAAFKGFKSKNLTVGKRNKQLYIAVLQAGPLSEDQKTFLLSSYQAEYNWSKTVNELMVAAHITKYPWSGEYNELGAPFWWMYEYAFKPLTATMFAMLAFFVASAAFRAFRAKNLEANLLLGTAFIVLLGRTFAGVLLTSWVPESLSALKIENLTLYIMTIFNTAGSRAIMIGIALGIASTSLKVLLGIDRSYLGSSED